jgi:hypothetical protein
VTGALKAFRAFRGRSVPPVRRVTLVLKAARAFRAFKAFRVRWARPVRRVMLALKAFRE